MKNFLKFVLMWCFLTQALASEPEELQENDENSSGISFSRYADLDIAQVISDLNRESFFSRLTPFLVEKGLLPSNALDEKIQARVLEAMRKTQKSDGSSLKGMK